MFYTPAILVYSKIQQLLFVLVHTSHEEKVLIPHKTFSAYLNFIVRNDKVCARKRK